MQTTTINIDSIDPKFYDTFEITKEEVYKIVNGKSAFKKGWNLALTSSYTAMQGEDLIPKNLINEIIASIKSSPSKVQYAKYIDWEYDIRYVILHRIFPHHENLTRDLAIFENLCKHWSDISEIINTNNIDQSLKASLNTKLKQLISAIEKAEGNILKKITEIISYNDACKDFIEEKNIKIKLFDDFLDESDETVENCFEQIVELKASLKLPVTYKFDDIQPDKETYNDAKRSLKH